MFFADVVRLMCLFMSLGRILLQGSVLTNLFDPMRPQMDLWKVEVGIEPLEPSIAWLIYSPPGVNFAPLLGRRPTFSICFLVYFSLLHEFHSQGIGFGPRLFAGTPE